jgi:hypothetical protein
MAANERDDTGEWLLPADGGPPTLYDLEQRVEVALSVARAAETAALEIGAASIEAAQQARRAAEMAERASLAAVAGGALPLAPAPIPREEPEAAPFTAEPPALTEVPGAEEVVLAEEPPAPVEETIPEPTPIFTEPAAVAPEPPSTNGNELHDERLRRFAERADRLSGRLRALELSK